MKTRQRSQGVVLYQPPIVWILLLVVGILAYFCIITGLCPSLKPEIANVEPAWSPDGTRIAFATNRHGNWELYLVHVTTFEESRLTSDGAADQQPAWTPGGDRLAFVSNRDRQPCRNLYTLQPETKHTTRISLQRQVCDQQPSWTPTTIRGEISKKVVFASDRDDGKGEIYVTDIDTLAATRVTFREGQPDLHPTISPDGSKIAFQSFVDGNWEIFVMDSDGRNIKPLSLNPTDDIQPAWSPDGQKIAFASRRTGNWEIFTMDPDGGNVKNLTINLADDQKPTWSPDAKEIAFQSNRTGRWEIWRMKAVDGAEQKPLTGRK